MTKKPKPHRIRSDFADVPLEASKEMVQQLAALGEVKAAVEVIETMEELSPQKVVSDVLSEGADA